MPLYDLKLTSSKLDTGTFPPSLTIQVDIDNHAKEAFPILLSFSISLQSSEHYFTFWDSMSPQPGRTHVPKRLALEAVKFLRAKEQLGQSNGIHVNIVGLIVSEAGGVIASHSISFAVERDDWVLALQEDNKPKPTCLKT